MNTRFDPRDGDAGLKELEDNVASVGLEGRQALHRRVEQRLARLQAERPGGLPFLEKAQELGIKNIHVHKGPTIWPLDKDAFDVSDVDHAATDFPELNFIVEHVGLPRIEDFCFMATQEPNVYAGLSVVIGGLMHARPKFFAKVMGELLFWVGEDKMTFGSDYSIWEPKWQIEGFVDWDYPDDEFSDYPRVNVDTKKKILGLNAAKLYGIEVPAGVPAQGRRSARRPGRRPAGGAREPTCDPATADQDTCSPRWTRCATRSWTSRSPTLGFVSSCTVSADGDAQVRLRLPTFFCAPNFAFLMVADAYDAVSAVSRGYAGPRWCSTTTSPRTPSTPGSRPGPGSPSPSAAWPTASWTSSGPTSCARPCWPGRTGSAARCSPRGGRWTTSPR